ncbi:glutamate decarboxylase [Candidatus Micrarchaeota archaeon]|nr:glutamate decarboxylase [Candidatus Micrarchaeota archaeon]
MVSEKVKTGKSGKYYSGHISTYSDRYMEKEIPKYEMPARGMPANAAYQLVHDETNLDGNPSLNLASFVTTWMEPEADQLMMESLNKNFIDHDEYPQTEVIHQRVVNMLGRLFNAPKQKKFIGTGTIGSSEAIMLGLLAHKFSWRNRRKKEGKKYDRPNMVMGADVHTVWDKFARYFDVEPKIIPMEPGRYTIGPKEVEKYIDENTICVGAILGTTFTGQADDIEGINKLLLKIKKRRGWDIPIHVDGASGGFVAPFVHKKLKWDFRLEQVKTINVSGHKYGLVYPGLGWLIFRDKSALPDDIVFKVNYLGGEMPTYTLNFSRGSATVLAQYYNMIRLGKEGYTRIMKNSMSNAQHLAKQIKKTGKFEMLSVAQVIPVVTFQLKGSPGFTVYALSKKLREKGWIVPAYTLPKDADKIAILRVVVKENFSRDMADLFFEDLIKAYDSLKKEKPEKKKQVKRKAEKRIC